VLLIEGGGLEVRTKVAALDDLEAVLRGEVVQQVIGRGNVEF
jgi:hypothetical protein